MVESRLRFSDGPVFSGALYFSDLVQSLKNPDCQALTKRRVRNRTRSATVRDDALHALVDTFDGGDLIITQTGFGLIEKRRLRWFREDGSYLGSVVSKDPIRRVYSAGGGIIVETRQRRAVVQGVTTWWE
jgi:hypothetical protein